MASLTAAPLPVNIIVDENGDMLTNGVLSNGFLADDPGPGGLPLILTYRLPFMGVQGDVFLVEFDCGCLSDVIRFNGDGTLLFYSENIMGFDSLADTFAPPQDGYPNFTIAAELGDNTLSAALYTPGEGDPGFDASNPTYTFVSESGVPEPGSLALLGAGLSGLGYLYYRRERAKIRRGLPRRHS